MNKHLKNFFIRGLIFGGFGPLIMAIIYFILDRAKEGILISGTDVFIAVVSIYLLAFIHAGVSVFNQIESWSIAKSLLFHFSALYVSYTLCYIINSWIPFKWNVLLIYTAIFIVAYGVIWLTVLLLMKRTSKRLNSNLKKH